MNQTKYITTRILKNKEKMLLKKISNLSNISLYPITNVTPSITEPSITIIYYKCKYIHTYIYIYIYIHIYKIRIRFKLFTNINGEMIPPENSMERGMWLRRAQRTQKSPK